MLITKLKTTAGAVVLGVSLSLGAIGLGAGAVEPGSGGAQAPLVEPQAIPKPADRTAPDQDEAERALWQQKISQKLFAQAQQHKIQIQQQIADMEKLKADLALRDLQFAEMQARLKQVQELAQARGNEMQRLNDLLKMTTLRAQEFQISGDGQATDVAQLRQQLRAREAELIELRTALAQLQGQAGNNDPRNSGNRTVRPGVPALPGSRGEAKPRPEPNASAAELEQLKAALAARDKQIRELESKLAVLQDELVVLKNNREAFYEKLMRFGADSQPGPRSEPRANPGSNIPPLPAVPPPPQPGKLEPRIPSPAIQPPPAQPKPDSTKLELRIYRVGKLADNQGELLQLMKVIAPPTWTHNGGRGEVAYSSKGQVLVIYQTPKVHKEIGAFLERLEHEAERVQAELRERIERDNRRFTEDADTNKNRNKSP